MARFAYNPLINNLDLIGITSVQEDTSPKLGGNLDVNGFSIVSSSNGNITLAPNGSGDILLSGTTISSGPVTFSGLTYPTQDAKQGAYIGSNNNGTLSFGWPLNYCSMPNLSFPIVKSMNTPIASTLLYSVPSGKRAVVTGLVYCNKGSSSTYKINVLKNAFGVSYQGQSGIFTGSSQNQINGASLYLEQLDSISITNTVAGVNIWFQIAEFDNTCAWKIVSFINFVNGNNTVYTCPIGKKAVFSRPSFPGLTGIANSELFWNSTGVSLNFAQYLVPFGSSPNTNNQVCNSLVINNLSTGSGSQGLVNSVLDSGDSVVINTNTSAAGQYWQICLFEF